MQDTIKENVNVLVVMLIAGVILAVGLAFSFNTSRDLVSRNVTVTLDAPTTAGSQAFTLDPPSFYRSFEKDDTVRKNSRGFSCVGAAVTGADVASSKQASCPTSSSDTTFSDDGTTITFTVPEKKTDNAAKLGPASGYTAPTITYRAMKGGAFDGLLANLPFFITLGAVIALFGVGAFQQGSGTLVDRILAGFLILVVGGTLLLILQGFITGVENKYNGTALGGVSSVVGLLSLAVAISLVMGGISVAAGGESSLGQRIFNKGKKHYAKRRGRRGRRGRGMMYGM